MLFTSGEFLFVYLPVALGAFFLIARLAGRAAAALWLALASLVFYGYWRPEHVALLVTSILVNYLFGALILQARSEGRASARGLLTAAVAANLVVLGYFKYANFFVSTVASVSGEPLGTVDVLLPLGISFFTFTQIAYLVDVHAGKVTERNPIHYALFVTYFPHLIAGPVLHHAEMMPQFAKADIYRAYLRSMTIGLAFLTIGLAKKILVADSVAPLANDAFAQATVGPLTTFAAWLGMLAYTLQIYFDFSGYSDMAVGLSLLIGVRLPYNFNSPYKARNISDFWRRWHMTLSRFLRDYLYIALGGNRRGAFRRYSNLLVTMLLGGLWHGASWTFVVWGGLHGIYLCVNHVWQWLWERIPIERHPKGPAWSAAARLSSVALTLLAVIVAWVFFRATTIHSAFGIVGSLFGLGNSTPATAPPPHAPMIWIALFSAIALFARNSQQLIDGNMAKALDRVAERSWYGELLAALCGAMIVVIVLLALIAASRNVTEFIYFNF
jgi:D-alanyl-lipoteichoic acid acyltransferase DltB (MBOAT superfamily)